MRDNVLRLECLRTELNLKQKDIAEILKIKQNTYSKWERGINDIPLYKLNELANFYKVTIDYLMGITNENLYNIKEYNSQISLLTMAERIKSLRKNIDYSQKQIADYIGFNQRTYAHYEDGSRVPTMYKLFFIANFYNISMDYIYCKID